MGLTERRSRGGNTIWKEIAPSLVDLCVRAAIDNLRYLGDVGETDAHLLEQILPHCTVDQLMHVEKSTQGRDLSPITDKLWKKFYERQFGTQSVDLVEERMRRKKVSFRWIQLYEAKLKDLEEAQNRAADRFAQSYKKEIARKESRKIQLCAKVPPSSNKRSFYGAGGPSYNVSNLKGNLMKKAKIEFQKSQEVKNLAAMKRSVVQRNSGASSSMKPGGFSSASKQAKPMQRRF